MTASHWSIPASGLLDGLDSTPHYTLAGGICLTIFIIYTSICIKIRYDAIPAVGRTGFVSSYLDGREYTKYAKNFIKEGYTKYRHGVFRVPGSTYWQVLVSGPQLVDELRKAPDDVFSFEAAVKDALPTEWTFGKRLGDNPYHLSVIRNQLTRNIGNVFSGLREEIVLAFDDHIPPTEDWTKVRAYQTVMTVVSRASNRIFVGAPLCRDPEYFALNVKFAIDMSAASIIVAKFPEFLKPLAALLFTNIPQSMGITLKFLRPIIEERVKKMEECGLDYPDKPLDLLSWLLDEAQGVERSPEHLTYRLLMLNFAAIHTTSIAFTTALFELSSRPEYIEPIRQEVEAVVAEVGWTKAAMTRMRKLDSFLKETQRTRGMNEISLMRRALKEFTFSDGTRVPKGAFVAAASGMLHLDEEVYPDANTFKGFRFSDMRDEEGEGTKNQMAATSTEFLLFGHGRHACPGRFFAVNVLKALMAHVVLTYDIKMMEIPRYTYSGPNSMPDMMAEVFFRKRRM